MEFERGERSRAVGGVGARQQQIGAEADQARTWYGWASMIAR